MKKLLLIINLCIVPLSTQAQENSLVLDWAYSLGNAANVQILQIDTDSLGNVYTLGAFYASLDFDPGPSSHILTNQSANPAIFIRKTDKNKQILWVKQISFPAARDSILSNHQMVVNAAGDVFLAGTFQGSVDFDPGTGIYPLSASHSFYHDIYHVKLSASGNFLWANQIEGDGARVLEKIELDSTSNLLSVGTFLGKADFNTGPFVDEFQATTGGSVFIHKQSASGQWLWTKSIGNNQETGVSSLATDQAGNIIISGHFESNLDIDPDSATFILQQEGLYPNFYILKINKQGAFQWGEQLYGRYGNHSTQKVEDLYTAVAPDGHIYTAIKGGGGQIDVDPGPDTLFVDSHFFPGIVRKLNPDGSFEWVKKFGYKWGYGFLFIPSDLQIGEDGNLYFTGQTSSRRALFSEDSTEQILTPDGDRNRFLISLNASGDLLLAHNFYDSQNLYLLPRSHRYPNSLEINAESEVFFAGTFFDKLNIAPNPHAQFLFAQERQRGFLAKWVRDTCNGLQAIIDEVKDFDCVGNGSILGHGEGGFPPYSLKWNSSAADTNNLIQVQASGFYEFTVEDSIGCKRSTTVFVDTLSKVAADNLKVNLRTLPFRPGFSSRVCADIYNESCLPRSGRISLILDTLLSIQTINPPPDTLRGDTLSWELDSLTLDSGRFRICAEVILSLDAMIGDQVCVATILETANTSPTKNQNLYCRPVVNSYDPNDKQVFPQGACEPGFVEKNEPLTYTLRFQNTGNAPAIHVAVDDYLDADLDISSLKVLGQSHEPMITELVDEQTLRFRFDDINLPDSTNDEPNSHGFVTFEISPKENLSSGTEIINSAGIYFDFNEVIYTNAVLNSLVDSIPDPDTTFVSASGCNSYALNGIEYVESGVYYQSLSRPGDCEEILRIDLKLQPLDTSVTLIGKTLTANEGGAHGLNVSYQWVDCDNNNAPISGAIQQSFTPEVDGNYAVIISRDNCSELSTCTNVSVVGIDRDFQSQLKYYPNPSQGRVELELGSLFSEVNVNVLNALGQKVNMGRYSGQSSFTLNLPEHKGIYFVQIEADGKQAIIKLVRN